MSKLEWLGGRYTLPHDVRDGDSVFRPDAILWLELPSGVLVGSMLVHPQEPVTLAQSLESAMQSPAEGPPRRPSRIRVADRDAARELRAAAAGIPIVVAPVPELDDTFDSLREALEDSSRRDSYLGDGDIPPRLVEELFRAARLLFRTAPWRLMSDQQILRVDIPHLGIDGACLSVIGAAGESFGLMLFRSVHDYHAFIRPAARARLQDGLALRSLSFNRKDDLPVPLLQEVEQHRWPVAGPEAYPVVICVAADLEPIVITETDVRTLTAVTRAFLAFLDRHRELFEIEDPEPLRESNKGEDGIEVTLTAPFAFFGDEAIQRTPPMRSVGRNDPCPCGSGRKYKKCHLDADQAPR
jgi:SEC-C motif